MLSDLHPFYNHHFGNEFIHALILTCIVLTSAVVSRLSRRAAVFHPTLIKLNVTSDEQQKLNYFRERKSIKSTYTVPVDHFELLRVPQ